MKKTAALILPLACACMVALGSCGSDENASSATPGDTNATATKLVTRFLQDVKAKDTADLQQFLDDSWQIRRGDGDSRTKNEYVNDLPDLRSFKVSAGRGTESEDALVASYTGDFDLVVDGKPYKDAPAPFLASFVKVNGEWRMTTQANFNQPEK